VIIFLAESFRGLVSPVSKMDPILQTLDYWTLVSIEAHWKELVKEAQEANNTGKVDNNSDTSITG